MQDKELLTTLRLIETLRPKGLKGQK